MYKLVHNNVNGFGGIFLKNSVVLSFCLGSLSGDTSQSCGIECWLFCRFYCKLIEIWKEFWDPIGWETVCTNGLLTGLLGP